MIKPELRINPSQKLVELKELGSWTLKTKN